MRIIIKIQVFLLIIAMVSLTSVYAHGITDPLPSWRSGPVKASIMNFVTAVTDKKSPDYVPPKDRIATFDNDGTLWVEQPEYPQALFMLDRLKQLAPTHPEWQRQQRFQQLLTGKKVLTSADFDLLITETSQDVTIEKYQELVKLWFMTHRHPRYQRTYPELVYQPMLEVMDYLRAHEFKVYIVTGGEQDFVRTMAEDAYAVPAEQVVGATSAVFYQYRDLAHAQPELTKSSKLIFRCNAVGKPESIHIFIGKKPLIAFGNSDGDQQMLEWTSSGVGKRLAVLLHHDDAKREYAYDASSKIGKFSSELKREARAHHWLVISMKKDWSVVFPFNGTHEDKPYGKK